MRHLSFMKKRVSCATTVSYLKNLFTTFRTYSIFNEIKIRQIKLSIFRVSEHFFLFFRRGKTGGEKNIFDSLLYFLLFVSNKTLIKIGEIEGRSTPFSFGRVIFFFRQKSEISTVGGSPAHSKKAEKRGERSSLHC